jgi:hypothetical protein
VSGHHALVLVLSNPAASEAHVAYLSSARGNVGVNTPLNRFPVWCTLWSTWKHVALNGYCRRFVCLLLHGHRNVFHGAEIGKLVSFNLESLVDMRAVATTLLAPASRCFPSVQ